MDVIIVADHIIDLGPEGGSGGGVIQFTGTPEEMIKRSKTHLSWPKLMAKGPEAYMLSIVIIQVSTIFPHGRILTSLPNNDDSLVE